MAHFVVAVVEQLDLGKFDRQHAGRGWAAHHEAREDRPSALAQAKAKIEQRAAERHQRKQQGSLITK